MPTAATEYENKELYKRQEKGKERFRVKQSVRSYIRRSVHCKRIILLRPNPEGFL